MPIELRDLFEWNITVEAADKIKPYIKEVNINKTRSKTSRIEIVVNNPIETNPKECYPDAFARDKIISIYAGWNGKQDWLGTGIVVEHDLQCDQKILRVICADLGYKMGKLDVNESWPTMKDSDIASQIAMKWGTVPMIESTKPSVSRAQNNKSDYAFLRELAGKNSYDFFLEYNPDMALWELHFHPPKKTGGASVEQYDYAETKPERALVRSFAPVVSGEKQLEGEINFHYYLADERTQKQTSKQIFGDDIVEDVWDLKFQNQAEADAFIQAAVDRRNSKYLEATAEVVGNPKAGIGDILNWKGLTFKFYPSLDGNFRVIEYGHKLSPNSFYTQYSMFKMD